MKVIFTIGLPASGKSIWAKQFCKDHIDYVRVSRDDLRNMRGQYWIPQQEELITTWERSLIQDALNHDKNVIIDATNLNPKYKEQMKRIILDWLPDTIIEEKIFDTSLEECIIRDSQRSIGQVGEKVIREFHKKYFQS